MASIQTTSLARQDNGAKMMSRTVMIVEDNAMSMKFFNDLLEVSGYRTLLSRGDDDVETMARNYQPDLILMDVRLKHRSGLDIARELKARSDTRTIPIVAVTAYADHGARERCLESGCDDYLSKPVGVDKLRRTVGHYAKKPKLRLVVSN